MVDQILWRGGISDDKGDDPLAQIVVGETDHGRLVDRRM